MLVYIMCSYTEPKTNIRCISVSVTSAVVYNRKALMTVQTSNVRQQHYIEIITEAVLFIHNQDVIA